MQNNLSQNDHLQSAPDRRLVFVSHTMTSPAQELAGAVIYKTQELMNAARGGLGDLFLDMCQTVLKPFGLGYGAALVSTQYNDNKGDFVPSLDKTGATDDPNIRTFEIPVVTTLNHRQAETSRVTQDLADLVVTSSGATNLPVRRRPLLIPKQYVIPK